MENSENNNKQNNQGDSQNMLLSLLPMLLKNSGNEQIMPLLSILSGEKPDMQSLIKHMMSQPKTPQKTSEPVESELNSYTRLE